MNKQELDTPDTISGFRLAAVQEISTFIDLVKFPFEVDPDKHSLNFTGSYAPDAKASRIAFNFGIHVGYGEADNYVPFLGTTLLFTFELEDFEGMVQERKGEPTSYQVNAPLMYACVSVMIGTLRGF